MAKVKVIREFNGEHGELRSCPKCSSLIEKQDLCNYIVCPNCMVHWCWICGCKMESWHHFNPINVFGCPGNLMYEPSAFFAVLYKILIMILIGPLILEFTPMYTIYEVFYPYGMRICGPLKMIEDIVIKLPILLIISIPMGIFLSELLHPVAFFVQMYRIYSISLRMCCCCIR